VSVLGQGILGADGGGTCVQGGACIQSVQVEGEHMSGEREGHTYGERSAYRESKGGGGGRCMSGEGWRIVGDWQSR
jgi:hypothetical protein